MSEAILKEDAFLLEEDEAETREGDPAAFRASQYLSRFSRLNQRIRDKLEFRDQLWRIAGLPSGDPFAMAGQEWENGSAASIRRMVDLEQEIDRDIDHLENLRKEIDGILSRLDHPGDGQILRDLYLNGMPAPQAIHQSRYTKRHFNRLKHRGLVEVDRILREERPMRGYVSPL